MSISDIQQSISKLPREIQPLVLTGWQSYLKAVSEKYSQVPQHSDFIPSLCRVWAGSDFMMKTCIMQPDVLLDLFESGHILLEYPKGQYKVTLEILLKTVTNQTELEVILREFRCREMMRIAWRDLSMWATPIKTMNDLSRLADAIITLTNKMLFSWLCKKLGTPLDPDTKTIMPLLIIAMGKLGAFELNFSSDVDLIYCFPKEGQLAQGKSYSQFYLQLARQLTSTLNTITQDGFVYRVDLRLRPYGSSGSLVCSIPALIDYYHTNGREWERYALVKARIVNYESLYSAALQNKLRQFVYRDYIDYSAIESLRQLQQKITLEVKKRNLENNIKRGPGGIREIEFISQTYKIIRGGRHFRLQDRNTIKSLILLREIRSISTEECNQLSNAYLFLRDVENKLQIFNDKQTHELPADTINQDRIAYAMRYSSWINFTTTLEKQRNCVQHWFDMLIAKPNLSSLNKQEKIFEKKFSCQWQQPEFYNAESINVIIQELGYSNPEETSHLIMTLHGYTKAQQLSKAAINQLNMLLPRLVILIGAIDDASNLFRRMLPLIEAIIKQSIYLVLLAENPIVLSQAIKLCSASPWIANELAQYPLLLDELLDPTTLYAPPTLKQLRFLLNKQLKSIATDDLKQKIQTVCFFKQTHTLKVAAAEVTGTLRLMRVSDYLTDIATVVVDKIRELILQDMLKKYGSPTLPRNFRQHGFAIIAYGKLGGIELSYSSDLDLVFLHSKLDPQAMTQGKNPISNQKFYTRLGQQIVKTLNQQYACGALYKVDLRLRPSGKAGLLVSSVAEFDNYQNSQAWNWEHQALVRSRPLCGAPAIGLQFSRIRENIMVQRRIANELKRHIVGMRTKMRDSKLKRAQNKFDLKQGVGGLVDIEFIAQYAVLRWSYEYPSLLEFPDNVRIFERVGMESLMRMKDVQTLTDAYKNYRSCLHRAALQNQSDMVDTEEFVFYRIDVARIWAQIFNGAD